MRWTPQAILDALDRCCAEFTFPVLDNGYVYPAATRLSVFRSATDWALTIEVFGFSPREGIPSTAVYAFSSEITHRDLTAYRDDSARARYVKQHPNDELSFVYPLANETAWMGDDEHVAGEGPLLLRGNEVPLPAADDYGRCGVALSDSPRVFVFELCRVIGAERRADVLATEEELRKSLPHGLECVGRLDEWRHPDITRGERASGSETFRQISEILCGRDFAEYRSPEAPNSHWRFWPDAGTL